MKTVQEQLLRGISHPRVSEIFTRMTETRTAWLGEEINKAVQDGMEEADILSIMMSLNASEFVTTCMLMFKPEDQARVRMYALQLFENALKIIERSKDGSDPGSPPAGPSMGPTESVH